MSFNVRPCRFVPRHDDELELEVDDPLLVEVQGEDYWYEGYNMRTGAHGIFPAYYAIEVTKDTESYKGINVTFFVGIKVTSVKNNEACLDEFTCIPVPIAKFLQLF